MRILFGDTGRFDCDGWPLSTTEDERRAADLLERRDGTSETGAAPLLQRVTDAALFGWWTLLPAVLLLVGLGTGAYALKSWLGVDLFDGHFMLHGLLFG